MTACLTKALRDGLPWNDDDEDDEPQSLGGWAADAVAKQFVNAWPIFGHEAANAWDWLVNGKRQMHENSVFMTPIMKAARAVKLLTKEDADDEDSRQAAWYLVEMLATSGIAPIPTTGIRHAAEWFMTEEE